jgi:hypothetical protein
MYQAGCWPEGGGTTCLLDSTLEAVTGTVTVGTPRDSAHGPTSRNWVVPVHIQIHIQQWDYLGACNGLPLSCFTNRAPTAEGDATSDSTLVVGQDAYQPAQVFLRGDRVQWVWYTNEVAPTHLYDSLAAAAPPAHPGVRDMKKLP